MSERQAPAGRGSRRTPLVVTTFNIPKEVAAERNPDAMSAPARCLSCRHTFDMGLVTVTRRYLEGG